MVRQVAMNAIRGLFGMTSARLGRRPRNVEAWLATVCLNLGRSGFRHRARHPHRGRALVTGGRF
jgi:hypothetical protein